MKETLPWLIDVIIALAIPLLAIVGGFIGWKLAGGKGKR